MGFGHRVYKNYDPRARIIKQTADEVFEVTGKNPLLDIALKLEEIALSDPYFIDRKLYPNVDFYSGLIYQAMGFPVEMFTVLFAIPRTSGWLAHWDELLGDKDQKISRPRQWYTGVDERDYVPARRPLTTHRSTQTCRRPESRCRKLCQQISLERRGGAAGRVMACGTQRSRGPAPAKRAGRCGGGPSDGIILRSGLDATPLTPSTDPPRRSARHASPSIVGDRRCRDRGSRPGAGGRAADDLTAGTELTPCATRRPCHGSRALDQPPGRDRPGAPRPHRRRRRSRSSSSSTTTRSPPTPATSAASRPPARRHRRAADRRRHRRAAPTTATSPARRTPSLGASRRRCPTATGRPAPAHRLRRRGRHRARPTRSTTIARHRPASSPSRRTRCTSRSPTPAPTFIGADHASTRRWAATGQRRQGRHLRRARHAASGPSTRRSPTRATSAAPPAKADGTPRACNFGDNPLTPADGRVRLQQQADRRPGRSSTPTTPTRPGRRDLPRHRPRHRRPRHPHRVAPRPATSSPARRSFGVDRGPIHGIAPGAWVVGVQGLRRRAAASAPTRPPPSQQAILDGVDVINFSISRRHRPVHRPGRAGVPRRLRRRRVRRRLGRQRRPGRRRPPTTSSPWVTTVAASTQTRDVRSPRSRSPAADGATADATRAPRSRPASRRRRPVVLAVGGAVHRRPVHDRRRRAGIFAGKIVVCQRGGNGRVEKGFNVLQGGAAGMILYNPTLADIETDNHWLPAVHLADGTAFARLPRPPTPASPATFTAGAKADGQGDVMAAFSSRGPAGAVPQARHHRARRADPRRPHPDARTTIDRRPARRVLPGHRRHVDVVAARRRRRRSC